MSDKAKVICSPVHFRGFALDSTPGSIQKKCSECGQDIWLARAGQQVPNAEYVCLLCVPPEELAQARVADGAFQELRDSFGVDSAIEAGLNFAAYQSRHKKAGE